MSEQDDAAAQEAAAKAAQEAEAAAAAAQAAAKAKEGQSLTLEDLQRRLDVEIAERRKANAEAKTAKDKLKEAEDRDKARAEAEMTDLEKAKARLAELDKEAAATRVELRTAKIAAKAAKLGFAAPEDAPLFLSEEVDVLDDKALEEGLTALLKAKPYLKAAAGTVAGGNPQSDARMQSKEAKKEQVSADFPFLKQRMDRAEQASK